MTGCKNKDQLPLLFPASALAEFAPCSLEPPSLASDRGLDPLLGVSVLHPEWVISKLCSTTLALEFTSTCNNRGESIQQLIQPVNGDAPASALRVNIVWPINYTLPLKINRLLWSTPRLCGRRAATPVSREFKLWNHKRPWKIQTYLPRIRRWGDVWCKRHVVTSWVVIIEKGSPMHKHRDTCSKLSWLMH